MPRPRSADDGFALVMARVVLRVAPMSAGTKPSSATWTVLLHVIMWTTMTVGFIMVWVVLLMH